MINANWLIWSRKFTKIRTFFKSESSTNCKISRVVRSLLLYQRQRNEEKRWLFRSGWEWKKELRKGSLSSYFAKVKSEHEYWHQRPVLWSNGQKKRGKIKSSLSVDLYVIRFSWWGRFVILTWIQKTAQMWQVWEPEWSKRPRYFWP